MTDITDQDKREARKWAEQTIANRVNSPTDPWVIAARLFLATVEPPAPTLAEELRKWAEKRYSGVVGTGKHELLNLATRAEQIEQDLDEARAAAKTWQEQDENDCEMYSEEVAGLLATLAETREALAVEGRRVEKRAAERDEARAEVERLTAERESREMTLHEHGRLLSEARAEVERLTAKVEDRKWEVQKYRDRCANQRKELDRLNRTDRELRAEPGEKPGSHITLTPAE